MRITYAIYMELALDTQLLGFWESIAQFEFCQGLDRANFRIRQEIARIEVEQVTEENRGRSLQVVQRSAQKMLPGALRRLLGAPDVDIYALVSLAHVDICEVPSAPNPTWTHGLEGPNTALLCPLCSAPMVRRQSKGRRYPFWGCSKFPECKGTRSMSR